MNKKKKISIIGAAESGIGAALLAKQKGFDVFVSDSNKINEKYKKLLNLKKIEFEELLHSEKILISDEIIKSPGVPNNIDILIKAKNKKIPIISEIEFASRYSKSKIIAVTGSNGKTTTCKLIYEIFKQAGKDVVLAGNIGKSWAKELITKDHSYTVLELSSFQLEDIKHFKTNVAILLNITPDHIDRHKNFENYINAKFNISKNLSENDYFVFYADDKNISKEIKIRKNIKAKKIPFSLYKKVEKGAYISENKITVKTNKNLFTMNLQDLSLQGKHNFLNAMAAAIPAKLFEIRNEHIRKCLSNFENIEHRLEKYINVHGIDFINDSKATNIDACWWALESMYKPVIWIAGGRDKGNDYSQIEELVKNKVKAIVCIGESKNKIKNFFQGKVPVIEEAETMFEAVHKAYRLAKKGDVVLLSPACSSFDMFNNYQERGWAFKKAVLTL